MCLFLLYSHALFALPSVAFFYGKNVPAFELCQYDWVVVDPHSDFNPKEYCYSISQPIAYASLGEVAQDAPYAKDIQSAWVIGSNAAWNHNQVIDQSQKGWQAYFLNQLIEPLWQQGYRGFFLDTLDSYFLVTHTQAEQQKQIDSLVSIISQIKARHPDAKIILNRGFQLLPKLHSQVDGVVIESFDNAWNQAKRAYEHTSAADKRMLLDEITKIKQLQLPIIIIDYLPQNEEAKAQALADVISKQGMIPWITNNTLDALYMKKLRVIPRDILVLFNNKDKLLLQHVARLGYIDSVLEYMGYIAKYYNLHEYKTLPTGDLRQQYAGIIVHIDTESSKNEALLLWLQQQMAAKIPVVFTNNFAVPRDSKLLAKLNLEFSPIEKESTSSKIIKMDSQFIGFEMTPLSSAFAFNPVKAKATQVLLALQNNLGQTQDAVAITSWGAYALAPYFMQYLPNFHALWVINPFTFFQQALRLKPFPVPDVTTENGRRLMSVHIDGDGFSLMARWIGGDFAAKELYDKILNRFKIPTGFSVITGELAPDGMYPKLSPKLMDIARKIFALPWIEIASHSFSHPFHWQINTDKSSQIDGETYTLTIPNYKFNLETEIKGSVDFINQYLAPANKKCHLFFWSGMADPGQEALAIASREKLLTINGLPDTYIDNFQPSLTGVQPMGMALGNYYQVFAPIDGDFYYMNNLAGPMYGFEKVIQTLKRTDAPRRLKPIDLYYHIYSGGYPASLEALIKVYTWALDQSVMNIYISDYIKKVIDYFQTKIGQKEGLWIIKTAGNLRELRSVIELGYPNLIASQNVIGFRLINGDLYLHLGPNPYTVLKYQKDKPKVPYLVEANGRVSDFSRTEKELVIYFKGHMPLQFTLGNVGRCRVTSKNSLKITKNQDETQSFTETEDRDEIHINC